MKSIFLSLLAFGFFANINAHSIEQNIQKVGKMLYISENGKMYKIDKRLITIKRRSMMKQNSGDLKVVSTNRLGYSIISVPDTTKIEDFVEKLKETGEYESVEYNCIGKYEIPNPNDAYFSNQWYIGRIFVNNGWDISTGSSSIKVAVIDSGVDVSHVDLGYGYDGYANAFICGWNYLTNTTYSLPTYFHGTSVAGVLGAKSNNSIGIAGVSGGYGNSGIYIMPYCIGNEFGPNFAYLANAIIKAVDEGAKVINISLTGGSSSAINDALNMHMIIMSASFVLAEMITIVVLVFLLLIARLSQ